MDGDANFMGVKVVGIDKAHIVGCHHWQSMLFCQRHRGVQITLFIRTAGADQLQVEAIREIFFIKIDTLLHQRAIAAQQAAANIAHTPAGDQQQPFIQLRQPLPIDPWTLRAVATLIGAGDQKRQVLITRVIQRQHGDLRHFIGEQLALNVKIGTNHRLHTGTVRRSVELHQTAQVGEVGDRQRRHAKRGRLFHQRPGLRQPINHGIVAVHPQVYETWFSHLQIPRYLLAS